ncbi:DNA polymerase IV [Algoriphagus sediminis]|uniref:DNA polymerase IV n=1 Tax=Algoriphagus sediminis TaxID=3057113 RepID=A0ABT7Y7P0_9BACT|nr:DNA polymerase IV [Algoriphagus sediminis]MDN3202538.1 DNA polymerase IV [Algoriphagus sediminis]
MNQDLRKIIHVDMDAFYASVEQLDHPEWRDKPLVVGGNAERGVIAAASYEARKYGVRSAMSSILAAKKCPNLIFAKARFDRYKEISLEIREIFYEFTDLVEPLSLDEAFLDVTENKKGFKSAIYIARKIREDIKERTGLNASAGVSYNKFLAKTASDLNKPNGQAVILPEHAEEFLERLPIEKFFGIGKVTAEKMHSFGIHSGADLKQFSLQFLTSKFGKSGLHYFNIVRGVHLSEVQPNRIRKSVSAENTFAKDIFESEEINKAMSKILDELIRRLKKSGINGRTISIKIKYSDYTIQTRSRTIDQYPDFQTLRNISFDLLNQEPLKMPVRLLGAGVSNLNLTEERIHFGKQLDLPFRGNKEDK